MSGSRRCLSKRQNSGLWGVGWNAIFHSALFFFTSTPQAEKQISSTISQTTGFLRLVKALLISMKATLSNASIAKISIRTWTSQRFKTTSSKCSVFSIAPCYRRKSTDTGRRTNVKTGSPRPVLNETQIALSSTFLLPPLSREQEQARKALSTKDGNVIINACAGSGKTTTLLRKVINLSFHRPLCW